MNTTQRCLFRLLNSDTLLSDSTRGNFASICQIKWNWIRSMKFEAVRIHFLSEVFALLSSKNFATMATWRNDFSSLLISLMNNWWHKNYYNMNLKYLQMDTTSARSDSCHICNNTLAYCLSSRPRHHWWLLCFRKPTGCCCQRLLLSQQPQRELRHSGTIEFTEMWIE